MATSNHFFAAGTSSCSLDTSSLLQSLHPLPPSGAILSIIDLPASLPV